MSVCGFCVPMVLFLCGHALKGVAESTTAAGLQQGTLSPECVDSAGGACSA